MLEITFDAKTRSECIGSSIEEPLFGVTSKYLEHFFPLLSGSRTDKLPSSEAILTSYKAFVDSCKHYGKGVSIQNEINHSIWTFRVMPFSNELTLTVSSPDLTIIDKYLHREPSALFEFLVMALSFPIGGSEAASIWIEFFALLYGLYYWLAPKRRGKYKQKPGDMFSGTNQINATYNSRQYVYLNKALQNIRNNCSSMQTSDTLIWQLVSKIFNYRLINTRTTIDQQYPNLPPGVDPEDYPYGPESWGLMINRGTKFTGNSLLDLAWLEIFFAIENNIYGNFCYICGSAFPIHKQHGKVTCGRKECKKVYEANRREKKKEEGYKDKGTNRVIPYHEYMREAKKKSRKKNS